MSARMVVLVAALLVVAAPLAGCLKKKEVAAIDLEQAKADELLGQQGRDKLVDAASLVPKNFSFPGQQLLPSVSIEIPGSVAPQATGSYEAERDEGGVEWNTIRQMEDISNLVPAGQPVELVINLVWDASEVNSADLDIAVDVPGFSSDYSSVSESFNWNLAVKTLVVNTIGVEGRPAQVGAQIASGVVSQGFDYTIYVKATYVKDVLTPYHPWALEVPPGASGLIFESEKAGGDEHLATQFILIDPDDQLVQFVDFNDIDIPSQSIFVPTSASGTYVFYANTMQGGFLRVKADVPLQTTAARQLALVETSVVDSSAPAPGVAGKDVFNGSLAEGAVPTSDVAPTVVSFATSGAFPLRVLGYITGPATTQAKITLKSPLGTVHTLTSIARAQTEQGSLGYTGRHEGSQDNLVDWKNIQAGAWTAEIVNTSPGVEIGHTVLSYQR